MSFFSYHIFYFPFKWSLPGDAHKLFSEQVDFNRIPVSPCSMWERVQLDNDGEFIPRTERDMKEQEELFGERQYFFDFVHPVLYDIKGIENPIIRHYERREPKDGNVEYRITAKEGKTYVLKVDAINLNLYSSGVGILSFFLVNEREDQKGESVVRAINQFGRRIMPPHSGEFDQAERGLLALSIELKGLQGTSSRYIDSFDYNQYSKEKRNLSSVWEPALFIQNLIADFSSELEVVPVIDDRMLVNCWYGNDDLSRQAKQNGADENSSFVMGNFWYKYVFVDDGQDDTCQNENMKRDLLKNSTYFRWQKYGTMYGLSRYSLMTLTDEDDRTRKYISMHMRTIYSRMFELIIIQRASMLRFSGEVTKVGSLAGSNHKEVAERIGALYKEYIRFVNQIYFRNVTVQDQGIELYEMLMKQFSSTDQIKDLDEEIEELHHYITLLIDQKRSENSEWLNWLATAFLPASLLAGLLGMNRFCDLEAQWDFWGHVLLIALISGFIYFAIKKWRK